MDDSQSVKQCDLDYEQAAKEAREIEEEETLHEAREADWYSNQERDHDSIDDRDKGERMYTITQAATVLGVDPQDIEGWLEIGRLRGSRKGREWIIPIEEVALAMYAIRLHRYEDVAIEVAFGRAANEDDAVEEVTEEVKESLDPSKPTPTVALPAPASGATLVAPVGPAPALLSARGLSLHLGIPEATLRTWAQQRRIPTVRLGDGPRKELRFRLSDVDRWIARHVVPEKAGFDNLPGLRVHRGREGRRPQRKEK